MLKEVTIDEIKYYAEEFAKLGKKWHFHILTPECKLNRSGRYALIVENGTDKTVYACYSDAPYMDIGKQLVQLLHGNDVIKKDEDKLTPPSKEVRRILEHAKLLHTKGIFWHHHMLFPYCTFNKTPGKWSIVFENPENNQVIESVSDNEPKSDLKHIEVLFYSQKR